MRKLVVAREELLSGAEDAITQRTLLREPVQGPRLMDRERGDRHRGQRDGDRRGGDGTACPRDEQQKQ